MTMTAAEIEVYDPVQVALEIGGEVIFKDFPKKDFEKLCTLYPEYRIERDKNGTTKIMAPVKGMGGFREGDLVYHVTHWSKTHGKGKVSSPSGGFDLPDGSVKSPDVAWVSGEKLSSLDPKKAEEKFLPIVPDFIAEIRSKTDDLDKLKEKMQNVWIANGVRLAWLIDPYEETAYVYRLNGSRDTVKGFDKKLDGEDVLPGFELDLSEFKLFGKD